MNKKRKGNRKTIIALALSFCMLFGTMLTAQAKDYIVFDNLRAGTTLQTGDRVLSISAGDIILHYGKTTWLNYDEGDYSYEETDRVTVKADSEGVEVLNGTWEVWMVEGRDEGGFDVWMDAASDENSSDEGGSRKSSHTSSYERGLKYAAQEKVVKSYSTLTNPGIDGNGHPLIYSTFVKEMPAQIAAAPENGTVTFGNPTYNTLPGTVMEALKERPDVTLVFEFNYEGSVRKITIPAGKADTNGYEYYGPALLLSLYGE